MAWRHWYRLPLPRYTKVGAVGESYFEMHLYNMGVLGGLSLSHSLSHRNLGLWLLNCSFAVSYLTLPFVRARCRKMRACSPTTVRSEYLYGAFTVTPGSPRKP